MTGQDLLQVSYALFQELGRIILQMLCPFQPCWCPSQQLMEITGCRAASTAGQPQGFERIPAAYIQCKNVLLRPGPARGEPSPPFSPAALSAPAVRSTGGMCVPLTVPLSSRDVSPLSLSSSQEQDVGKEDTPQCVQHYCAQGSKRGCASRKLLGMLPARLMSSFMPKLNTTCISVSCSFPKAQFSCYLNKPDSCFCNREAY